MLSCTSSNKLTKGKYQRVPQNLDNPKNDGLWNWVKHWVTYPTLVFIHDGVYHGITFVAISTIPVVFLRNAIGRVVANVAMLIPSVISLPGTELLQFTFRTGFSMGSRSQQYRRSLWRYRQFLRSYRRSLRRCRDP